MADAETAPSAALGLGWELLPDGFTVRSDQPLAPGTFNLQIDASLQDLAGFPLPDFYQQQFEAAVEAADIDLFELPDPRKIPVSSVGNLFGFHGHPRDPETGLIYIRNRYYDPEIGRFITPDPMGYIDGPSMYQFTRYSPQNFRDPLGLDTEVSVFGVTLITLSDEETEQIKERIRITAARRHGFFSEGADLGRPFPLFGSSGSGRQLTHPTKRGVGQRASSAWSGGQAAGFSDKGQSRWDATLRERRIEHTPAKEIGSFPVRREKD